MADEEGERRQHKQHQEGHHGDNLQLEVRQRRPLMPNLIGDQSGEKHRMCNQHRRKRKHAASQEPEPARPIRVEGVHTKGEPRHLPEEAVPDEQAKVPANEDEAKDREADEGVPVPGGRQVRLSVGHRGIPGRDLQRYVSSPQPMAHCEDEDGQQHFRQHRISHTHRGGDDALESEAVFGRDDVPFEELPDDESYPLVNDDLGSDHERKRAQKSSVGVQVEQKRHGHPAHDAPGKSGEKQERQPGDQRDADDPPAQEVEGWRGQSRAR